MSKSTTAGRTPRSRTTSPRTSPRLLSIDSETYGKGDWLPPQSAFNPRKCHYLDGIPPSAQTICVSITLPLKDPPRPLTAEGIASLEPGHTLLFDFQNPSHIPLLHRWLTHADVLLGFNLPYDLLVLRAHSPLLAHALNGRHLLVDGSPLNYLDNPSRPEQSLKNLSPLLGISSYEDSVIGENKLPLRETLLYCADDTHNTLVLCASIARRILSLPPTLRGDKLSPFSLQFYSDLSWSTVWMSENGVPLHRPTLETDFRRLHTAVCLLSSRATSASLLPEGPGSDKSKALLLKKALALCPESLLSDPTLELTKVKRQVSFSEANLTLISRHLPPTPESKEIADLLSICIAHERYQKLLSTYYYPLLHSSRKAKKGKFRRVSILVPQAPFLPEHPWTPAPPPPTSSPAALTPESTPPSTPTPPSPPTETSDPSSSSPESIPTPPTSSPSGPSPTSPSTPTTSTASSPPSTSSSEEPTTSSSPPPPSPSSVSP